MSITIANVKSDVTPKLHGTSLSRVPGTFYRHCFEAANRLKAKIDPRTTVRVSSLVNALYGQIYDYEAPTDLKGNKIIDIRPQVNRDGLDEMRLTTGQEFDVKKYFNTATVRHRDGVKFLRISKELEAPLNINTCDSLTQDGNWAASTDASNLSVDTFQYLSGSGALKFDLSGSTGVGVLTNPDMLSKDIDNIEDIGALFLHLLWPSATAPTSVTLRWGSSASDYWEKTITAPHDMTTFRNGWNLLRFDWPTSETGSPDASAVDYVRLTINYASGTAVPGVYVDGIVAVRKFLFDIEYHSENLFRSASGTWKELPTVDTDILNLDGIAYNIFLYELMDIISQLIQAEESTFDSKYFRSQLDNTEARNGESGLYEQYAREYPSESLLETNQYYDFGFDQNTVEDEEDI